MVGFLDGLQKTAETNETQNKTACGFSKSIMADA